MKTFGLCCLALVTAMPASAATRDDPAAVIRGYYAAIAAGNYPRAYGYWDGDLKQSYQDFAHGYAETTSVTVRVGRLGRIEGAAGNSYVEVPVDVRAKLRTGQHQHFAGRYVLRVCNDVPGCSAADLRWHLYSASLHPVA